MSKRLLIALTASLLAAGGCNLIYKQNIQQGNALEQEDLDQLRLGMSQNQVAFLLGTPSVQDPFHHDRWDYVSSFSRRGGEPAMRTVTLFFEDGALVEMIGVEDVVPVAEGAADVAAAAQPEASAVDAEDAVVDAEEAVEQAGEVAEDAVADAGADLAEGAADVAAAAQPEASAVEAEDAVVEAEEAVEQAGEVAEDAVAEDAVAEDAVADAGAESAESAAVVTAIEAPEAVESRFAQAEAVAEAAESVAEPPAAAGLTPQDPALTGEVPGAWIIQLGAFDERKNADNLVQMLGEAGVDAGIITQQVPGLGDRYLVRHGGLESKAEAEALLERIRAELGVRGFAVPPS